MTEPFLNLFVGDTTQDLADFAKRQDVNAYLIDSTNINQLHCGSAYVSLGDINDIKVFFDLLLTADKIIFVQPTKAIWSDGKTLDDPYSMAWITLHYIQVAKGQKNILTENLPTLFPDDLYTYFPRVDNHEQLWIAGCSTSFGTGVQVGQRYCDYLATQTKMNLQVLAEPGSSNRWVANQILRADICENDIVVWGLTTLDRFEWMWQDKICHIGATFYQTNPDFNTIINIDSLDSLQRIYESVCAIESVENFCKKVKAKLLLVGIHSNINLSAYLSHKTNFLMIHGTTGFNWNSDFLDYGSDNLHPGPKTHKMYAEKILKKLKQLEWLR